MSVLEEKYERETKIEMVSPEKVGVGAGAVLLFSTQIAKHNHRSPRSKSSKAAMPSTKPLPRNHPNSGVSQRGSSLDACYLAAFVKR